jgi:hypothetical protein
MADGFPGRRGGPGSATSGAASKQAAPRLSMAALTPTADTNTPGRCCTQVDTESVPCQAMDGAGHLDHALQAAVAAKLVRDELGRHQYSSDGLSLTGFMGMILLRFGEAGVMSSGSRRSTSLIFVSATARYSRETSMPTNRRPRDTVATPVVPDPTKGSSHRSAHVAESASYYHPSPDNRCVHFIPASRPSR